MYQWAILAVVGSRSAHTCSNKNKHDVGEGEGKCGNNALLHWFPPLAPAYAPAHLSNAPLPADGVGGHWCRQGALSMACARNHPAPIRDVRATRLEREGGFCTEDGEDHLRQVATSTMNANCASVLPRCEEFCHFHRTVHDDGVRSNSMTSPFSTCVLSFVYVSNVYVHFGSPGPPLFSGKNVM